MKKIYFSFTALFFAAQICNAQLSLTKALNEPGVGDVNTRQYYDSTTAVPKAVGAGQSWSFLSLVSSTLVESSTYTTVASTPSSAAFPGATLAEDQGNGDFTMLKMTPSTYEIVGIQSPGFALNFTNTAVFVTWPVNFGSNSTDQFSGSTTAGTTFVSFTGTINVNASGTGTVVMPGGLTLTNCLQVVNTLSFVIAQGTYTQATIQKEYSYFHSSNKFPVLSIIYESSTSGTVVTTSFDAKVNSAVVAGLSSHEINNNLLVFPNPSSDYINIKLDNSANKDVSVSLTNLLGQEVKKEFLGKENSINSKLNVTGLPKGIYIMNLSIGNTISTKKIVVE
ncbi:MAG: T9SS type A sorting domain-containing protein [Bacteroidota bacterium]|nr:T9SS type A sorting domain-containing protein [Bacteroidota bacterium]MDP3144788.1 T9SS type A sorting domain-containing protein [Bacteroidota bacterium]